MKIIFTIGLLGAFKLNTLFTTTHDLYSRPFSTGTKDKINTLKVLPKAYNSNNSLLSSPKFRPNLSNFPPLGRKCYSSDSSQSIAPVLSYSNADTHKIKILKDNRRKSGIYRWVNKTNGKTYVGSAKDLSGRMQDYYSLSYLVRSNMAITKALLKYGYSNFILEILEYCELKDLISREQHYLDTLEPEYNIRNTINGVLGFNHTDESKAKMIISKLGSSHSAETKKKISDQLKGKINPFFGKTHSQETKELMSKLRSGVNHPLYGKPVSEKTKELISKKMSEVLASRSFIIYLYSLDLELITTFPSSKKAGKYFGSSNGTIMKNITSCDVVFKDKYILSLKELPAK